MRVRRCPSPCRPRRERVTQPRAAPRLDQDAVRRLLRAANLRARHSLSQNFLTDVDVLEAILAEAAPAPGGRVLEIGPGLGILTGGLLDAGAALTAVELDSGLAAWLGRTFEDQIARGVAEPGSAGSLTLIEGDILDQDLASIVAPPFDVVANLPYHITSPVLHRFLGLEQPPRRMVLMVQREVAERIAASPGAMSYLSVFVQYHATVRIALAVPRAAFEPEPNVDSAVVVRRAPRARGGRSTRPRATRISSGGSSRRRFASDERCSTTSWRGSCRSTPGGYPTALSAAGIDPDRRPQTLSVDEWLRLRVLLGPIGSDQRGRRRDEP